MIELTPVRFPSTNVLAIGFEGDKRGNVHVQFCDKEGNPTVRGFYRDVQRAIYNGLENDRRPGSFIDRNLKKAGFEWVAFKPDEPAEIADAREHPDPTLPNNLFIPADVVNNVEAIAACIDSQRIQPERKGLFE